MKYWEIIADNLSKTGWSWGCVSAIDSNGANNLDCRRTPRQRKASRCACGRKADCVFETGIGDSSGQVNKRYRMRTPIERIEAKIKHRFPELAAAHEKQCAERLRARDYEGYLLLFGGHKRLLALLKIEHLLPDKDYRPQPNYLVDLVAFGIIVVTAIWPIFLVANAMAATLSKTQPGPSQIEELTAFVEPRRRFARPAVSNCPGVKHRRDRV